LPSFGDNSAAAHLKLSLHIGDSRSIMAIRLPGTESMSGSMCLHGQLYRQFPKYWLDLSIRRLFFPSDTRESILLQRQQAPLLRELPICSVFFR
jgi:hypothetical protein